MRKKLLLATIGLLVALALVACGDKDNNNNNNQEENNEPANENNEVENNNFENNEEEEEEASSDYEVIHQGDIPNIDYTDLGDKVDTMHLHHSNDEVFDYMSMSGSINDIIVEDNKYYFTNASRYYSHDVDSLELVDTFEPDRNSKVNITEDYTVFVPDMGKFVLTILHRETGELKEVDLESNAEYSTHIFPYSDGDLTLVGVIQEVDEEEEIDLYAINHETGKKELVLEDYSPTRFEYQEALFDDENFYVYNDEGILHAFDRSSYDLVWTLDHGDDDLMKYNLHLDDDHVYVASSTNGAVYKVDKSSGDFEVVFDNPDYPVSGIYHLQDDSTLVVFGSATENIGFIDLDSGEVLKEIELSHIFQMAIDFNDNFYMLLTTEDDDDRKLLEIPSDSSADIQLIDLDTEGGNEDLGLNVVDDILHITANRHYIQINK